MTISRLIYHKQAVYPSLKEMAEELEKQGYPE